MLPLRIAHIDNDLASLEALQALLHGLPGVSYLQGFTSADAGLQYLRRNSADLVLLDVQLLNGHGPVLADELRDIPVDIIFYTPDAGYALPVSAACGAGYLLKPAAPEELRSLLMKYSDRKALRLKRQIEQMEKQYADYLQQQERPARIFVNVAGQIIIIKLEEVLYLQASNNYTLVFLADGKKHIVSKPIKTYEEALRHNADFLRIHRSYIVNRNFISMVERDAETRRLQFVLSSGDALPSSFKTKEEVLELLMR